MALPGPRAPLVLQLNGRVAHPEPLAKAGQDPLQRPVVDGAAVDAGVEGHHRAAGLSDQMCMWCTSPTSGTVSTTVRATCAASRSSGRPSIRT